MSAGVFLADAGNIGAVLCAAIDTTAVISYQVLTRGAWRHTPVGVHLMVFIAAFAVVLDLSAVYLLATDQVLVSVPQPRPDWSTWLRVLAFCLLIPPVLAWRLYLIWRPPGRERLGGQSWPHP